VAGDKDNGHVNFRVAFGADGELSVNGVPAGAFDPGATYKVTVECHKVLFVWVATTVVRNETTGVDQFAQIGLDLSGATERVRATGMQVMALTVE
jgi:hypothetical protein